MQNELTALRPQLLDTSDETERLMIKIEQDTIQVEAKKEIVACDEALANEAAAAAQAIRDDCENDLAEAIPALQSAVASLNTLDPADITIVKTMKNPTPIIRLVVEAVCVMKGVAPDRKPDLENQVVTVYCSQLQFITCSSLMKGSAGRRLLGTGAKDDGRYKVLGYPQGYAAKIVQLYYNLSIDFAPAGLR